jgi:RNA polymerase sigma factor (sigma-70 family)
MSLNESAVQTVILPACQHDQISHIYIKHHGWLLGWLHNKLGCSHQAADLSHDTFIKLLKKQSQINLREPRAYLTTIACSLVINYWRRCDIEQAYLNALVSLPETQSPSLESNAIVIETLIRIEAALDGLPVRAREAFLLSQLEGLTYKVIGDRLGVSERMIKKYMAQAMLHCLLAADAES